ncbi:TIM barrel protein [Arsenicicoccus cauae]|nr:TIM barrel protein [Arsenicicoccus cauae]
MPNRPQSVVTPRDWLAAERTLRRVAALGESEGVTFQLENLNLDVDHPGVPFARAADVITLLESVGSPALRMNLDLYHAQIGEGNLIELCRRALPLVGEIQVADVPGRCEPGTGEISYPGIARALAEMGYAGVVALEGWASGDSEVALERFRDAFTL